jgi:hypothetical protein
MDCARGIIDLMRANCDGAEIMTLWRSGVKKAKGPERNKWMKYGAYSGCLAKEGLAELEELFEGGDPTTYPSRLC